MQPEDVYMVRQPHAFSVLSMVLQDATAAAKPQPECQVRQTQPPAVLSASVCTCADAATSISLEVDTIRTL
jgi:hypothetical protein